MKKLDGINKGAAKIIFTPRPFYGVEAVEGPFTNTNSVRHMRMRRRRVMRVFFEMVVIAVIAAATVIATVLLLDSTM
jgi:hypothetical protein